MLYPPDEDCVRKPLPTASQKGCNTGAAILGRSSVYFLPGTVISSRYPLEGILYFEIVGEIADVEVIAVGPSIRQLAILQAQHGIGKWRKLKGIAWVRVEDGRIHRAEVHWYEAHGIGRRRLKIKRVLT
jgi:hypothetical protein